MHRLDPTTTVLTAALALLTAFALASETPFAGSRGRTAPLNAAEVSASSGVDGEWVALHASGGGGLALPIVHGR